jgi:hypothetical protein
MGFNTTSGLTEFTPIILNHCSQDQGGSLHMPQWLANTLRVLGLILVIGTTFVASAVLLLMSMCSGSSEKFPYFLGAAATVAVGAAITVLLVRAISNSTAAVLATPLYPALLSGYEGRVPPPPPPTAAQPAWSREPLSLSPEADKAVRLLVWMMGAQIVVSILCWFLSQSYFSGAGGNVSSKSWLLMLLVPFFCTVSPTCGSSSAFLESRQTGRWSTRWLCLRCSLWPRR